MQRTSPDSSTRLATAALLSWSMFGVACNRSGPDSDQASTETQPSAVVLACGKRRPDGIPEQLYTEAGLLRCEQLDDPQKLLGWGKALTLYPVAEERPGDWIDATKAWPDGVPIQGPTSHQDRAELEKRLATAVPENRRLGLVHRAGTESFGDTRHFVAEQSHWEAMLLVDEPIITGEQVEKVEFSVLDSGGLAATITLDEHGAKKVHEATKTLLDRKIAMVHGDVVLMAPVVREPIAGGQLMITFGADGLY